MSEKKPRAGEFWEWSGVRLRIVGTRINGSIVAEHECGHLEFGCRVFDMKDLPECDSFEWQPEPVEPAQETTGKTYIKLWLNQQSGHVSITDAESDIELVGCDELKHDGTGFFLAAERIRSSIRTLCPDNVRINRG